MRARLLLIALGLAVLSGCQSDPSAPAGDDPVVPAPTSESPDSGTTDDPPMGPYGCY